MAFVLGGIGLCMLAEQAAGTLTLGRWCHYIGISLVSVSLFWWA
jgi:hypothetical protein